MAAPLERPSHGTPLASLDGTVARTPDEVFHALEQMLKPASAEGGSLSTDREQRLLVVQGGWWYRAEYRVAPDPDGARVTLEIVNVAQPAHWAGPITGRAALKAAPAAFRDLLAHLA